MVSLTLQDEGRYRRKAVFETANIGIVQLSLCCLLLSTPSTFKYTDPVSGDSSKSTKS